MGYNLTNEAIQNTYQQLVQVSGSTLLDGTGSAISFTVPTASYATFAESATTASYALYAVSASHEIIKEVSASHADMADTASYVAFSNVGSLTSYSSSVSVRLTSNESDILTKLSTSTFNTYTSSVDSSLAGKLAISTFNSYTSSNDSVVNALVAATSSYLTSLPSGIVSGAAQLPEIGTNTTNIASLTIATSSYTQVTESRNVLYSNPNGGQSITIQGAASWGDIVIKGGGDFITTFNDQEILLGNGSIREVGEISASWGELKNISGDVMTLNSRRGLGGGRLQSNGSTALEWYSSGLDTGYLWMRAPITASGNISAAGGFLGDLTGTASFALTASYALNAGGSSGLVSGTGTDSMKSSDTLTTNPASATGNYSIALGDNAGATNTNATSIGYNTIANGLNATALGQNAAAGGANAVAVGACSSNGTNAVAIGEGASASQTNTQAVGVSANASGNESVAIGTAAGSSGGDSVMIGTRGSANTDYSVALGGFAEVTGSGTGAVALGNRSKANHANGISIGYQATISADNGINIGGIFKYDGSTKVTLEDNVEVSGQIYSPTFAGSIASATSSVDFNNGNFATLSLTAGTFLANPSNLKSGTTYTIIISSGSLISGHGTSWKFSGGTAPTYTNGTDVLTCVSDGTSLYATALTDFQ